MGERSFQNSHLEIDIGGTIADGFRRVLVTGKFSDSREPNLDLAINGAERGYTSFAKASGHVVVEHFSSECIYLGGTAVSCRAGEFLSDLFISVRAEMQRIIVSSTTTYALSDGRVVQYQGGGYLTTDDPLVSLLVRFNGVVEGAGLALVLADPSP